ncbi:MAG: hypothetical protein JWO94_456 [Verrucomicrobiaceae bacterium]|nr:hypothetical protein [Verrucomicrobiaceae bacterium]
MQACLPCPQSRPADQRLRPGYILLELIIALTIFAIAVLGLTKSLNTSLEVANILNHDYAVRLGLRSFMEEIKRKSVANMTASTTDPLLDVTYTAAVEPTEITLKSTGEVLTDIYQLTGTANYSSGGKDREESMVFFLYQPQAEQDRRKDR